LGETLLFSNLRFVRFDNLAQSGLQLLNGSTPIAYVPDSASAGNQNQWFAGTASGSSMTIPLTVQHVRTDDALTPGTVRGLATFTMAYE
jgi:type 1 fimbria pilin